MEALLDYYYTLYDRTDQFFLDWYNMYYIMEGLEFTSKLFFFLLWVELGWDVLRKNRSSIWEPMANYSFHMITKTVEMGLYGMLLGMAMLFFSDFAVAEIPFTALTWTLCLILTDLSYYWMHRCEHRVRLLWALHSVHHSSEEYDLTTALRLFWLLDFTLCVFFAPIILIGFHPLQVISCMFIVFTYMTWVHTNKIGKLGWFDRWFNSPSVHRVHHGANRQYIDKNYAGILVIWDRLFGSYEPEVEPVRFGLTKPINTNNPLKIGFHEVICLARDVRDAETWGDRFNYLFKGPGWRPPKDRAAATPKVAD